MQTVLFLMSLKQLFISLTLLLSLKTHHKDCVCLLRRAVPAPKHPSIGIATRTHAVVGSVSGLITTKDYGNVTFAGIPTHARTQTAPVSDELCRPAGVLIIVQVTSHMYV